MNNAKQLGTAILQYQQDNNEVMPTACQSGAPDYNAAGWAAPIYPYVKSTKAFTCPDDTTTENGSQAAISYAFNKNILGSIGFGYGVIATMKATASTVMLCEVSGVTGDVTFNGRTDNGSVSTTGDHSSSTNGYDQTFFGALETGQMGGITPASTRANLMDSSSAGVITSGYDPKNPQGWHTQGSNFIMADGHVKWLRATQVSPGITPKLASGCAQNATNCTSTDNRGGQTHAASTDMLGAGGFAATFSPI
jgi:prepilin-type processing-associated H-X9-DG protein